MPNFSDASEVTAVLLAIGALGSAAFGIVEGLKWTPLGTAGFQWIRRLLGPFFPALENAYGSESLTVLRAAYHSRRGQGDVRRLLRQGIRLGLRPELAGELAEFVGTIDPSMLAQTAESLQQGKELSDQERATLGRFELAVDARIDAALDRAETAYTGTMRVAAAAVALAIAVAVGTMQQANWRLTLLVGIAAIPLAPITNDVVNAIQAAATALRRRR